MYIFSLKMKYEVLVAIVFLVLLAETTINVIKQNISTNKFLRQKTVAHKACPDGRTDRRVKTEVPSISSSLVISPVSLNISSQTGIM